MRSVAVGAFPGWHIRSIPPSKRDPRPLDALVPIHAPRGGLPLALAPGVTYHFWADVAIPKGTSTGTYSSRIDLLSEGRPVGGIDVQLTVWPMMLPDTADLAAIVELDHRALFQHHIESGPYGLPTAIDDWRDHPRRGELDAVLRSTLRMLQAHRLTPVLPGLMPTVRVDRSGELAIDWAQYDEVVAPLMTGRAFFNRVPLQGWPLPVRSLFASQRSRGRRSSPALVSETRAYLGQCVAHFEEKGWLDRAYAALPYTVAEGREAVEATNRFAEVARSVDERVPIASFLFPQDLQPYGWFDYPHGELSGSVDIWMPPAQFYDPDTMAGQRAVGRRTWLTVDRPPFSGSAEIFAPSSFVRVLSWQALALGAEAIVVGEINRWPTTESGADPQACADADPNVLLYPGRAFGLDEPIASVRLKHLRRAMQDAAYVRLLSDHGLEHITETVQESLVTYAGTAAYRSHFADGRNIGWVDDDALFDIARKIMAEELMRASGGNQPEVVSGEFGRTAAWRRFMTTARSLDLRVDGTRVRIGGTPAQPTANVECNVSVLNRTRVPIAGQLRFGELPEGWVAKTGQEDMPPVPPGKAKLLTREVETGLLSVVSGGVISLPIELVPGDGSVHRAKAKVSCVTAVPVDDPPRIDGDLSDWPPGVANVAADFRLIAGYASEDVNDSAALPASRTFAFVMRDDEYLYVAVNSEMDRGVLEVGASRKGIRYDDLIPVDEELVELLIDPMNLGTRSPSDLYHIAVKRSGTDVTEKGIAFDPPCGRRDVWPVDIEVASSTHADRWIAEIRIPLDVFGPGPHRNVIWGFNVTRYDAARQEFATWSGAVGNAYDPLSLGNLYLP